MSGSLSLAQSPAVCGRRIATVTEQFLRAWFRECAGVVEFCDWKISKSNERINKQNGLPAILLGFQKNLEGGTYSYLQGFLGDLLKWKERLFPGERWV